VIEERYGWDVGRDCVQRRSNNADWKCPQRCLGGSQSRNSNHDLKDLLVQLGKTGRRKIKRMAWNRDERKDNADGPCPLDLTEKEALSKIWTWVIFRSCSQQRDGIEMEIRMNIADHQVTIDILDDSSRQNDGVSSLSLSLRSR